MRYDLQVPYPQKDEAKALGARWDFDVKTWFIVDHDPRNFGRWHPVISHRPIPGYPKKPRSNAPESKAWGLTVSEPVLHCGCLHVLPWEDCEHTLQKVGFPL